MHPMATATTSLTERIIAAGPDIVTTAAFLTVWLSPLSLGSHAADDAMLIMIVEFILLHASAMLGALNLSNLSRSIRVAMSSCLAGIYFVMIGGYAWTFQEWWPLLAFSWLLLGKLSLIFNHTGQKSEKSYALAAGWIILSMFYLSGVTITALAPVPELGITQASRPSLELTGSGLWVDEPQRVVAFGVLYFGLSAWARWNAWFLRIGRFASRLFEHR